MADTKYDQPSRTGAMTTTARAYVGTAGWAIPAEVREHFPADGSALERYAARLPVTEVNSSFHRPHRRNTYERWAASVPAGFRFSVKLPKTVSHAPDDDGQRNLVARFADEIGGLGDKLAVVLVQFPPKRAFDLSAVALFERLSACLPAALVCGPRHASWFTDAAEAALVAGAWLASPPIRPGSKVQGPPPAGRA